MKYRPEIDGLRTLAVLPVLLFHAGVPFFAGGYIGVDVFFVISGYLITSIICHEVNEGKFTVFSFYERRIRRILPCLVAVTTLSLAVATILFLPSDFHSLSKSVVASTLFSSNVLFWKESGYFDGPAEMKPLLHTWSLSVEEQFYVLFPLFLVLGYRYFRSRIIFVIAIITLASLSASIWGAKNAPTFTFYMAPTRAWELLVGSLLALGAFPTISNRVTREAVALIGVILIGSAILLFSSRTPFPGFMAIVPVSGAALIVHTSQGTSIGRILSLKPIVFTGLISYSLYLWHWPIIVFAEYYLVRELSGWNSFIIVILSFITATFSWRFIEKPFRDRKNVMSHRLMIGAGTATIILLALGAAGVLSQGWPSRVPPQVSFVESFKHDVSPLRSECHRSEDRVLPLPQSCTHGAALPPEYAIWGDSHAVELSFVLGQLAGKYRKSLVQISYSSCLPFLSIDTAQRPGCRSHNEDTFEYLAQNRQIRTVLLVAFYDNDASERSETLKNAISLTVRRLVSAGKDVVLVYPFPRSSFDVPSTLARYIWKGMPPETAGTIKSDYLQRNVELLDLLDSLADQRHVARVVPHELLCPDALCSVYIDGRPLYFDNHHPNVTGVEYVASLFEPIFAQRENKVGSERK